MPESKDGEGAVDLSTLRTFRVLRPLKLVSGVPSEYNLFLVKQFFSSISDHSCMRVVIINMIVYNNSKCGIRDCLELILIDFFTFVVCQMTKVSAKQ